MPSFDKAEFGRYVTKNVSAATFGIGSCAEFVRHALAAAGLAPATHPRSAMGFREHARNGYLAVNGQFNAGSNEPYVPALGDIVVMQGTSGSEHGHMAGYNGTAWVSDFVQRDLWPGPSYRKEKPAYAIFRWPH
jgi:hypothetical protein